MKLADFGLTTVSEAIIEISPVETYPSHKHEYERGVCHYCKHIEEV